MSLYNAQPVEKTLSPGCPWYQAQVDYGTPNVDWCEASACSYFSEPANTWSNLGFLIVGIYLIRTRNSPEARRFGWIVAVMGVLSAIYHATNNAFTQRLDFLGMALMTSYLLIWVVSGFALKGFSFLKNYWFFVSLNLLIVIILDALKIPIQLLLMLNAVPLLLAQLYLILCLKNRRGAVDFFLSFGVLVVAQISAQIDLKRIYCDPAHPWLHGHVIWHGLCALAMLFAARSIVASERRF